jgi:hypothetical protein
LGGQISNPNWKTNPNTLNQFNSMLGGSGNLGGGMQNPYQSNLNSANSPLLGGPMQQNPMMGTPDPMSAQPVQQSFTQSNMMGNMGGPQPSQGKGSGQSQNIGYPQSAGMMGGHPGETKKCKVLY